MVALAHTKGTSVAVFGLGKAGIATLDALVSGGANVWAWDDSKERCDGLMQQYPTVQFAPYDQWPWKTFASLVLAPGVPLTHPEPHGVVKQAKQHGVEIVGDVELLWRECPEATYVVITGTNGKSTTTALVGHVLKSAGVEPEVGGNLGTPALSFKRLSKGGVYVIEASSYMLDLLHTTRFHVAVFLNITPDHLDRHGSMEGYVAAKMHIFDRQNIEDFAVVAVDDAYTESIARTLIGRGVSRVIPVSAHTKVKQGVYVEDGRIKSDKAESSVGFSLYDITSLTGKHNWQNAGVAVAACQALGLSMLQIETGIRSFAGLAHRMEQVAVVDGIRFINDSKATNADATANALAPYDTIYWILGGKPKEGGIESLGRFFPKIRHAFLIGAATEEFARTLEGNVPYTRCGQLADAFSAAANMAFSERKDGAVVLLSPACASFDQWKSFEQRGDAFRNLVQTLATKNSEGKRHAV